jgi:hypothetical protein
MTNSISKLNGQKFSLFPCLLLILFFGWAGLGHAQAQTRDLTAVVLIDSSNTAGYNTSPTSPGSYQQGPERYLVHLQIPYRLIDVSQTAAQDLTSVQLIVAGHSHLGLSGAWQDAITTAVAGGTGFVNLDNDIGIGAETHIRTIFNATGATIGQDQTTIVIPAAAQVGGANAHYIAALQRHWLGDPAGDITYKYHGINSITPTDATLLTGATGTVVAELGTDPLIIATTYGQGRAVDFTSYDYMLNDRFGFAQGCDDLFWRSLVWAARKPFAMRGYPRIAAIQMDDNEPGVMSRIPDLWNTTLTGTTASDGTGGPWKPQLNLQLSSLADAGGERAQMITAIQANNLHASPHGLDYGSGGDLYWNLTIPNTDAQWQTNVASALTWKQGQGGTDIFPTFSRSMVAHYWDISNNSGYEMWNSLGLRYVTSAFVPGTYYFTDPKTPAQRLPLGPFRIYQQQPEYSGDYGETFPFYYADDLTIGSVAGEPAQTFFAFASEIGLSGGRFDREDTLFPSTQNSSTVAQSLNQWEYYMWHFWSGMEPVQIYTHDGDNLEYTTQSDRQSFVTQLSQWVSTNKGQHVFMDSMGDYLRATKHSLLAQGSVSPSTISLSFTGSATDADGNLIPTKTYIFYGDDEGTLLSIPGFSNGGTYTFPYTPPPNMQLQPTSLSFTTVAGSSPASQNIKVAEVGTGNFTWTASSDSTWLSTTPTTGAQNATAAVKVNGTSLAAGNYNGNLSFTSTGVGNSPQAVAVALTVTPKPALVPSPTSLAFTFVTGGATPPQQIVTLTNPAGTSLTWTVSDNATWLTVTPGTPGTPGSLIVTVSPTGLSNGTRTGTITVKPTSTSVATITIPVSFVISAPAPTFTAAPATLAFSAVSGSASAASQPVSLTASLPTSVTWHATSSASWLTLSPSSGTSTPATLNISATAVSLAAGTYNGTVTIVPSSGGTKNVAVSFTVSAGSAAKLALSPTVVDIFGAVGSNPVAAVSVLNNGTGAMAWTAASNASWLLPTPTSSTSPGTLTLNTNTSALSTGNSTGNITVTSPGVTGSPAALPVTLHLGTQVFTDTFTSSAQWTPSPLGLAANWSVVNNTFFNNGGGHTQQYAGSSSWTNYILSVGVQLSNLSNYPGGIRGRVNTSTGVSYAVWLYPADHVIKLFRTAAWNIDTSGLQLLGTSPIINFDTQLHTVRLGFVGSQITVFYDNTLMITATDATLPSGAVALDVSSQPISFSNVVVLQQ